MSQSIQTLENRVMKSDADSMAKSRQIGYRAEALTDHARAGYRLTHTVAIEGEEYLTFVDTLWRHNDKESGRAGRERPAPPRLRRPPFGRPAARGDSLMLPPSAYFVHGL
jgi:hypothetical protein